MSSTGATSITLDDQVSASFVPDALPQRLVVCLDGTWNKRDSGTNIYHLSNLITEGVVGSGAQRWIQRVYYDEGVGTGVLDSVTGGAFGIGLEENVRQAYDWLVEKYQDERDEVYVFGFSRGAFTARSLVGLIGKCGLLYRGAPLSPEQLWNAYRLLGRYGNVRAHTTPKKNWGERMFGRTPPPFRAMWDLRRDPWERGQGDPIQTAANDAERLLVRWSRRIPITCLGVFDTVGSLGLDALALPGLRSSAAMFHDTRLTSIIVNAYQALAIDEHRSNFKHIPWHRDPGLGNKPTVLGGEIEQRWFAGAHSNVGGGYDDNVLTQIPLEWMLRKITHLPSGREGDGPTGLVLRAPFPADADPTEPPPINEPEQPAPERRYPDVPALAAMVRDSFAEFGGGKWQFLIRAKRNYRQIQPCPEIVDGKIAESANELVDPSAIALYGAELPPNLWAYRRRTEGAAFKVPCPPHRYPGGAMPAALLGAWLSSIVITGTAIGLLCDGPTESGLLWAITGSVAGLFALLIDWSQSAFNHHLALEPDREGRNRSRTPLKVLTCFHLLSVVAAMAGPVFAAIAIWRITNEPLMPHATTWLLALDALLFVLALAFTWTAAPMADAGLSSIVDLQNANTPGAVRQCLARWTEHRARASDPLAPVVRSLRLDQFVLIPCYLVVLAAGAWVLGSLICPRVTEGPELRVCGLLVASPWCWAPGLALMTLCAVADWIEDALHLRFVREHAAAANAAPTRGAVTAARVAVVTKLGLFSVTLLALLAAMGWLALLELHAVTWSLAGMWRLVLVTATAAAVSTFFGVLHARR